MNSYLLKTIDSKLKMISEYPLVFGVYDVVSGIAGDLYYLLDCDDILSDTKSLLKIKEILNVIEIVFSMTSIQMIIQSYLEKVERY